MPEGLALALQTGGLPVLLLVNLLAGVVYGFAGFGAALVFIPLASIFVPPQIAVGIMAVTALGSAVTVLPRAWRQADRPRVLWMLVPAFLTLVPGIWLLRSMDVLPLRWLISGLILLSLAAMTLGWRRRMAPNRAALAAVGGAAGFIGGLTGLTGPVVILFNLAGDEPVVTTRANTLSFLTLLGVLMIPQLAAQGVVTGRVLWLGLLAAPVYMAGTMIGQAVFNPAYQKVYRLLGYGVITGAVVVGLPLWD
ncbi:sulfite exporter TauE/SafE family protein [Actibacterium sp. D379-3]